MAIIQIAVDSYPQEVDSTIELYLSTGLTPLLSASANESVYGNGLYIADFTDLPDDSYRVRHVDRYGDPLWSSFVKTDSSASFYNASEAALSGGGGGGGGLDAAGVRAAVGLASANLDIQLSGIKSQTDQLVFNSGQVSASVNSVTYSGFQDIFETYQYTESYPATGVNPTPAQSAFLSQQAFTNFTIVGTTISVIGLDGVTVVATYGMDDSVSPTQRIRET